MGSLKSASALWLVTRHGLPNVSVPRVGLFLVHDETEEVAVELALGLALALGDALALALADALGEALAATSGTILAEVFAVLVALAVGLVLADGLARGAGARARRRGRGRAGRAVRLEQQHLAEHEQGGLAHQLDGLLRSRARHGHDQEVGALRLDLGTGVTGAVDPRLDHADRSVHRITRRRLPGQRLGLQGHLGPAGQVKTESDLELVPPLGRAEQLSAEDAEQHGQDEHEQKRECPSRMRNGS